MKLPELRGKIEGYTVTPKDRVGNARALWTQRRGLLLTLWDSYGSFGQGECAPLPGYSPDTLEDCDRALTSVLSGRWDTDLLAELPSARFALETATLDLKARSLGVSLTRVLSDGAPLRRVARAALLGSAADPEILGAARSALARGITTVKVKVGAPGRFNQELSELVELRKTLGIKVSLRLDANGAWTLDEAREKLSRLAELSPELVEQPVAGSEVFSLGACEVPWAVDESLSDPKVTERVLSDPPAGCVAVVLKPALLGGLLASREIALRAQRQGLGVIITHLFDGPVAMAAACSLALSLPEPPWACGLDLHPALCAWELSLPQHAEEAWITELAAPGSGLPRVSARQVLPR